MEHNDKAESLQHFTIQIPSSSTNSAAGSSRSQHVEMEREIEPMFDKALTPSDVGKLNRLVIPKQQAERHFPLLGHSSAERGTELQFADLRTGKQWPFRYCYWGSSQSYVMTKGWSRFVRENNLAPGDTVLFLRDVRRGKFLIDYHHNQQPPPLPHPTPPLQLTPLPDGRPMHSVPHMFLDFSAPQPVRETRRVRLFGVNIDSDREDNDTARGSNNQDWGPRSI